MRFITFRSPGKPCLVKYFKWLLKVMEGQKAGKGHILLLDQPLRHIRSPKGTVPSGRGPARTLISGFSHRKLS